MAAQLIDLTATGQPLHANSDRRTEVLYASDIDRQLVQKSIIDQYLDGDPPPEGRTAVITAGPPGAGKTTAWRTQISDPNNYRVLDADLIKEYLLRQALADRIYDDLLGQVLADGHSIAPFELSSLVHDESTQLAEEIRGRCVQQGENIVVEATLQWDGHGPKIFSELAAADYTAVRIVAVEADSSLAHEQALQRWWTKRAEWSSGAHPLGGRFTPPAAIDKCYPAAGGLSICAQNALDLLKRARRGEIASVHLTVLQNDGSGTYNTLIDEVVNT